MISFVDTDEFLQCPRKRKIPVGKSGVRLKRNKGVDSEAELLQDTLTCGSCQKVFVLSEIVKFIQHKVHSCNKENNFIILEDGGQQDFDSDREDPLGPLVAASKGPSISAPICNRKGLHHQHHHLHRNRNRAEKASSLPNNLRYGGEDGAPQERRPLSSDLYFDKKEFEDVKKVSKEMPVIKEEVKDPSLRCSPKVMVNAYTNTIITGKLQIIHNEIGN
ncbi:hypothetical protein TNCV_1418971 [Trichonephila clavipes]|nr:hypothetical protein TNCV_1418971 [Trichonephila clavipes]